MAELNETNQEIRTKQGEGEKIWNPIEELELQVNMQDKDDVEEIYKLLGILIYPSSDLATVHMEANRLGVRDLRKQKKEGEENKEAPP